MQRNGTTIPTTGELVVTSCWCGIQVAIPSGLWRWAKGNSRNGVYCPLGHEFVYSESDADRLKAAEARETALRDQLHAAEADAEESRSLLIRDRQRFANGVCPCCNRTFQNVLAHMRGEHPDYDPKQLKRPAFKCSCWAEFETFRGLRIHQGKSRPANWTDPKLGRYSRHLTVTS